MPRHRTTGWNVSGHQSGDARELIDAAESKAAEIEQPMVVTVATDEGNPVAQHRMDGAWLASVEISRNKAYTAAALETSTDQLRPKEEYR